MLEEGDIGTAGTLAAPNLRGGAGGVVSSAGLPPSRHHGGSPSVRHNGPNGHRERDQCSDCGTRSRS